MYPDFACYIYLYVYAGEQGQKELRKLRLGLGGNFFGNIFAALETKNLIISV